MAVGGPKALLTFFKLDVGSVKSLYFFRDLFTFIGFRVTYENEQEVDLTNGEVTIVVYHGFNVVGSGVYILNTGINALFFRVKSRQEVDRVYDEFLKVRQITVSPSDPCREEEGGHSVFFKTSEQITIGIISE